MVRHEMTRHPAMTNATMRTAQGKPTRGMSCSRMMGKITPPLALPPVVSPMASARRRRNQCPRTATAGLNLGHISVVSREGYRAMEGASQKSDPESE